MAEGYGTHPTCYGNLSDQDLHAMWRESEYAKLTESQKLDLIQETVNRDASLRGELGSPLVEYADLGAGVRGESGSGVILIDYHMAVEGQIGGRSVDCANLLTYETCIHEDVHCWTDQLADGTIPSDPMLANDVAEYRANGFTVSTVVDENGNLHSGSHYLNGVTPGGYYIYYFEPNERDAHLLAEMETRQLILELSDRFGTEKSFEDYAKELSVNGYAVTEQQAIEFFQNPDFVQDLSNVLLNQYNDTNLQVDPATENAVKAEMVASYELQNGLAPTPGIRPDMNIDKEGEKDMSMTGWGEKDGIENDHQGMETEAPEMEAEQEKEAEPAPEEDASPASGGLDDGEDPDDEDEDDFEL